MTSDQPDYYQWIQDLTARSAAEQTRAFQRYNELMQRMLRGELNDPQLRDDYLRFAREEAARYTSDLTQLSLGYYNALLELGRSYNDRFFEQMLHHREPEAPAGQREAAERPRQVMLDLRGAAGQEVEAAIVVENKHATQAEISFVASDFVDVAGGSPFWPSMELTPRQFRLGPHEEAEVKIRLPLAHERFVPGHQYRATVVVRGFDELELIIRVEVEPAAEAAAPAPTADSYEAAAPEEGTPAPPKRRSRGAPRGKGAKSTGATPRRKRAGGAS